MPHTTARLSDRSQSVHIEALATLPVKQAANQVAARLGLPKRDAYQRALLLKDAAAEHD